MAVTQTTLAAAIALGDLILPVTSATGFAAGNWVRIDSEWIGAVLAVNGTQISVRGRGDQGTAAVPHNALALVSTGLATDYPNTPPGVTVPEPPDEAPVAVYGVSGAITIPGVDTKIVLNKAGVAAMTLAAPSKAQDGLVLNITSNTAQAHTVTATSLLSTGSANVSVATFAAQKGAGFTIMAVNGLWNVLSQIGITFT